MMESVYFLLVGVVLYFAADRILDFVELRRGQRFGQRSLVFFAILLVLAVVTFYLIQRLTGHGEPWIGG